MKIKRNNDLDFAELAPQSPSPLATRISAERPIESDEEDLLKRRPFVDTLVQGIRNWKGKESLVIALYGPWGSGKSSIWNLTKKRLKEPSENSPQIVEFGPWQWSGQDQIVEEFFKELGIALGRTDQKALEKKWKVYSARFSTGAFLAESISKASTYIIATFLVLSGAGIFINVPWLKGALGITSIIVGALSFALNWVGLLSVKLSDQARARYEATQQLLSDYKQEIKTLLGQIKRPLLVVIDDIDRLTPDEVKLLFRLVKANADFPNIIYLLLFQREIVEKSLKTEAQSGKDFLDKIVQVGFDVPPINRQQIKEFLTEKLKEVFQSNSANNLFEGERWEAIAKNILPYFESLRDIKRFLNSLPFYVAMLTKDGHIEINPLDLIALEVLRVFEPGVHRQILKSRTILTGAYGPNDEMNFVNADNRSHHINSVIASASEENTRPRVQELLKHLFPRSSREPSLVLALGGYSSDLAELRISHSQIFDRYFSLTISQEEITQAELNRVISVTNDPSLFAKEMRAAITSGTYGKLLELMEYCFDRFPPDCAVNLITTLYDVGDELPNNNPISPFIATPAMVVCGFVYRFLQRNVSSSDRRADVLLQAVQATSGLYLPMKQIAFVEQEIQQGEGQILISSSDDLTKLKSLCLSKLNSVIKAKQLSKHPKLEEILYFWRDNGTPNEAQCWVKEQASSTEGLLTLLPTFLRSETATAYRFNISGISSFIEREELEEKVRMLSSQELTDEQQALIQEFWKAIESAKNDEQNPTP